MVLSVWQVVNPEGTWVQLDKNSVVEFCENDEGEAWSLAQDRGGNQYLRNEEGETRTTYGIFHQRPAPRAWTKSFVFEQQNKSCLNMELKRLHLVPSQSRLLIDHQDIVERRVLTMASPATKVRGACSFLILS